MNINPTSCTFQGKNMALKASRFGVITKDGNLMNVDVIGDIGSKVTSIKCSTADNVVKHYHNKNGLSIQRILKISDKMQKNIKDGFDFLAEFIKTQI